MAEAWPENDSAGYPWLFRRTEFDVLEEEFDDVFRRHDAAKADPAVYAMEEAVLEEQRRTEQRFERELETLLAEEETREIGADPLSSLLDRALSEREPEPERDEVLSLVDDLRSGEADDVLYRRALPWAGRLFRWTEKRYVFGKDKDRDVFRVHVNVYLVPAKLTFANAEEGREDPVSLRVAQKEYELASVYLRRVLQSLQALRHSFRLRSEADAWIAEGQALLGEIETRRVELERRRPYFET